MYSWTPDQLSQAKNYFGTNPSASSIYQVARQKNLTPESLANLYTSSVGGDQNQILSNINNYLSTNRLSLPGAQPQPQTYPQMNWQDQFNQLQQNYNNLNNQFQGLSSLYNRQQTTPQTYPSVDKPTSTSGSTVNPTQPVYPQTTPNLNNYRGATYFNPQQNQYVSGGGLTSGY